MKANWKRFLSVVMVVALLLNTVVLMASAADAMTIQVSTVNAAPGENVQVQISLKDNPGISSLKLKVAYDEVLTLTNVEFDSAFGAYVTAPTPFTNPQTLNLISPLADISVNGTFATLTFAVSDDAADNTVAAVTLTFDPDDIFNTDYDTVTTQVQNGSVKIYTGIPGDVDGDKKVNNKDAIALFRYVADWDVTVDYKALDVNGDNKINNKDAITLFRYVAGWEGIVLHYGAVHTHELVEHTAVEATCTEEGNIVYWECSKCGKYFNSENAVTEITLEEAIIPAKGHTPVVDEAVPATETSTGLTEGSHCAVCNQVLVAQEVIPMLESQQYSIIYHVANNDAYLSTVTIDNPNPNTYSTSSGLTLKNVSTPGYTFLGWYDLPAGANAENIKRILPGETGDKELYAHWQVIDYTVQFESSLIPVDEIVYSVDKATALPVPQLDGYIFVGWSDAEGNVLKTIPKGSTGNKTYMANWMSERNKAWTKKDIGRPIIIDSEETDTILFTYEIGRIENVPLYVIEDFGYINSEGVARTISKEYTVKTEEGLMSQYTQTVANSTTNSSQWSLSSEWSDTVSVSENYLQENNLSETDAKTLCTTDNENWMVSSGSSGSTTTTTYQSAQEYDLHTDTDNTKTYDTQDGTVSKSQKQSADLKLGAKEYAEVSAGGNIKAVKVEGKAGIETTQELDLGYEGEHTKTKAKKTGTESDDGSQDQTGSIKHTGTDTVSSGGWNKSSSYGGSKTTSNTDSVSKTISERIASEYGYGRSYINGGGTVNTQGFSASSTDTDTYSSTVTYSTSESVSETITYTTSNTKTGYHRLIKAGTAHVFAIVGYDIKTASYFVNTFTVMDDESHNFEDYSYSTALYDDNQISVVPFEVPYEVEEYVLSKIGETEGLEFNGNGVVTAYYGTEQTVVIPEYHVVDHLDGTKSVIKVTSISSNAFRGNTNITGVQLSDFITDIPNNAFEGCTNLELINMPNVVSIGEAAFKDCVNIGTVFLSQKVENLGTNAFESLDVFAVHTNRPNVVAGATNSGAKNILIYVATPYADLDGTQITVGNETEIFVLNGCGSSLTNVTINSDATLATVVNHVTLQSTTGIPIKASSSEVQLGQVNANALGFAMVLTNDDCILDLYGESSISSSMGNTVLCRNLEAVKTYEATRKGVYSEIDVDGNILVCGEITNPSLIDCSGSIISINEEEYARYLNGVYTLTYDANGGVVNETNKTVYYGEAIGSLATPTRQGFTFDGWYTEASGGTKITDSTISSFEANTTVYAHWIVNSYTVSWNIGTGYSITVERTGSPNQGAATGNLSNGATIYYGDVLSVTYTRADYYYIKANGATSITVTGNVTPSNIYATAELNPLSDWVKESAKPSDARTEETKYSFTHRYYTNSSSSSMSGWTKYDTQRTGWGSTQGPVYSDPSNGSRNVWSESYVTSSNYKTVYHYFRYAVNYTGGWGSYAQSSSYPTYYEYDFDSALEADGTSGGYNKYRYWYNGSNYISVYARNPYTTQEWVSDNYGTRWYYQEPVYTYYFYKDVQEESATRPSGSEYFNIQTWVRYRAK